MERQDEEGCWEPKPSLPLLDLCTTESLLTTFVPTDNLYPTIVLTRVNLPEDTVTVAGTTIDTQFFRCVSACALPVLPCVRMMLASWSRRQFDCHLPLSDLIVEWNASVTSVLTEAHKTASRATASNDTQSLLCTLMHPVHEDAPQVPELYCRIPSSHCDFHHKLVHGSGAFVLTHWSARLEKRLIHVSW